jgi:signal transduction histidine kinase
VDATEVAAEVVEAWRPVAAGFGADLVLDRAGPAPVRADRLRLAQAVANLVVNAAEHGRGDVVVRVRADRSLVRIEVADAGPGPAPALVAEAARRHRGPTGARGHGLAVAAGVAARHGGLLSVAADGGVVLELPRAGASDAVWSPPDGFRRPAGAAGGAATPLAGALGRGAPGIRRAGPGRRPGRR